MNLLQRSVYGAVMIGVVIVIRAFTINRLPKKTFLILWGIVLLRLLVPFSVPSALSVYSLIEQNITSPSTVLEKSPQSENTDSITYNDNQQLENMYFMKYDQAYSTDSAFPAMYDKEDETDKATLEGKHSIRREAYDANNKTDRYPLKLVWIIIWCVGLTASATYFAVSYLRCRFEFRTSLPVENAFVQNCVRNNLYCYLVFLPMENVSAHKWIKKYLCHRQVSVRQSDRVTTPMTYGVFHPVILMPKSTNWKDTEQLQYILMHECVHICRYDALTKLMVVSALCIHWFNPMVWIMYVFFNRDVEISCDESVVRHMGETSKSTYARMLIQMEAERSGFAPLCNGLLSKIGKNAMEERITAIMKIKKKSMFAGIAAAVLVLSVTAAFATSAAEKESTAPISITDFTKEEYEMLLALKFDGYEDMSISAYRNRVWALTDTEKYNNIIERFFQDETIYAMYETNKGTDSNETYDFLYNVLGPIMGEQPIGFSGYAVTDFPSALENACLEYTGTLTIMDADQLTVDAYISVRHDIMERMGNILQDLFVSELRDEELMKVYIDEAVKNIIMTYQNDLLQVAVEYLYKPINGVAVDDMEEWQKERRDEWDRLMAPYVPFGLTYRYDWDTDEYKMYFNGKEVRGIYNEKENIWISEHAGIGKGIYAENAIELFVIYENHKIAGLREATAQEMKEITAKRQAVSEEVESEFFYPKDLRLSAKIHCRF